MSEEKSYEQMQEENATLLANNDSLKAENDLLREENDSLKAEVARLMDTPDAEEKSSGVGEEFEYDGRRFKLLASAMRIPGFGKLTAADIIANEKAQAWLVENKSGLIRELK